MYGLAVSLQMTRATSVVDSCGDMELMDPDEFIEFLKEDVPEDSLEDRLGSFPITNRGVHIWLLLRPYHGSRTIFQVQLPCHHGRLDPPLTIDLALWESNYYRWEVPYFFVTGLPSPEGPLQLRQVYLRYQDPPHHSNTTFHIDDSALTENGFTCCDAYPKEFIGNTLTLTTTDSLCVKVYSGDLPDHRFVVGFGQSFGKDWIHVISDGSPWEDYAFDAYFKKK